MVFYYGFAAKPLIQAALNLETFRLVLHLSLLHPLKPDIKSRMKMQLEQRRQEMLQLQWSTILLLTQVGFILQVRWYLDDSRRALNGMARPAKWII